MRIKFTDLGALLLRVSLSMSMIIIHGIDKLSMVLLGNVDFPDPLGIGVTTTLFLLVVAELICPVMVIIGMKVRYAVIPIVGAMLVALLVFHAGDAFAERELAYLYAFGFLTIFLLGPGEYSVDHRFQKTIKK